MAAGAEAGQPPASSEKWETRTAPASRESRNAVMNACTRGPRPGTLPTRTTSTATSSADATASATASSCGSSSSAGANSAAARMW